MEGAMEMEEDMEVEPMVFEVSEIDLEYEFDAVRWYDLSREESPAEARVAELWFETAQCYPPSPFVTKVLLGDDVSDGKTELSTQSDDGEAATDICESGQPPDYLATIVYKTGNGIRSGFFTNLQGGNLTKIPNQPLYKGPTFSNHIRTDNSKSRPKLNTKRVPRSSTLMKPTASQLAKQNNSRLHMQVEQINEKGIYGSSGFEIQAAKRQRLEEGLLRKVADVKRETNFVHKTRKKDAIVDRNLEHSRAKLTIPQEPNLATAQRAYRMRPKNGVKTEQASNSVYRFKARPFNRKIFEAPSLPIRKKSTPKPPEFHEFHLKTSERAMQHSSAVSTSHQYNDYDKGSEKHNTNNVLQGVNRETRRPSAMDLPKHDVSNGNHAFKARPLNKKEFNFHTEKSAQLDLPIDLFNKLSITSELQPSNGSHSRFPQPTSGLVKGSKENRLNVFQTWHGITSKVKGPPISSIQCGNNGTTPETSLRWTGRRNLGIPWW